MIFGRSSFQWDPPLTQFGAFNNNVIDHMPTSSHDSEIDRRIFPDRRRYSYSRHIPERRGTARQLTYFVTIKKDTDQIDKDETSRRVTEGFETRPVAERKTKRHLRVRVSPKKSRTRARSYAAECKRQLLRKVQTEIDEAKRSFLTKEEILRLIREL